MKKIVTIILSIMLIFQTTFGATLTVIINGAQITSTREAQEEVELTPKLDRIIGWQVNTGNVTIENNKFIMPNENVEIEAILSESDKYELTVENMYVTTTEEKEEGKEVVVTATSNDEYMFIGWTATGITLTEEQTTSATITITMPGNAVTLVANYGTATYTVTYNANGGSGAPASQTKTHGEALTLSSTEPTREGYTFKGWATTATATSATYQKGGSYTANANVTLYAVWERQIVTYTVTYNANGGSGAPASQTKTHGEALTLSSIEPTREGYTFKGWATSNTATTAEYEAGSTYITNANLSLYAVWQQEVTAIIANENVALGAYITYVPSKTTSTVLATDSGYTSAQTYNPSNTTSWRVLYNNNGQLDIISTESIGGLSLEGAKGYARAVYTLNKLCKDYINPTYADNARNPGYVEGSSCEIINTTTYPLNYNVSGFSYGDTYYSADRIQIRTVGVLQSRGNVWLASRYLSGDGSEAFFGVYRLDYSYGSAINSNLYEVYSDEDPESSCFEQGVRPIVTLKSGIKITGGEGTLASPYTISI